MKVVTNVHATSPTGGVELHTLQTSQALAARGHDVHLLHVETGSLDAEYRSFCASVSRVRSVDFWFPVGHRARALALSQMLPAVAAAVRRRPDVLYGNRVYSTGWAVPAGLLTGTPVVCHLHGHSDQRPGDVALLNRHVARFVPVSQHVADQWAATGLDEARITVVHNGVDPDEYPAGGLDERTAARKALGLPDDAFVVTCVARLDPEKGVDVLLRAWELLGLPPGRGRLLLVGSSVTADDAGAHLAGLHGLAGDGVVFLGNRRDVVTPLHAADVAVVPSRMAEPFGRTVIEALSTGRPVVASRVGGIPEILEGPLARFLVEPDDPAALADQLRSLRHWRDEEPGLAGMCRSRVETAFRLDQAVDRVEVVLRDVVG